MRKLSLFVAMATLLALGATSHAGPLAGAIFTTTIDGDRVNANLYPAKEDVYLDGGPGQNAPGLSAALPAGDYYFQVTDPSGKVLLSTDDIACRQFHVNAAGVIDAVVASACAHATGVDSDHPELGAITVQLMPYDDTPNPGGVYKVWVTPVERYAPRDRNANFGFVESWSKTDNYKVRTTVECDEELVLPTTQVTVCVEPGDTSYLRHTIFGAGSLDGVYEAWCVDLDNAIGADCYEMTMVSSLDPAAAGLIDFPGNWELVNYLLNQDYATTLGASLWDIQNAIWALVDAGTPHPAQGPDDPAIVAAILADVAANGEGFTPQGGQVVAIVLLPDGPLQTTIIPVLVPECPNR